ncbi:SUMF1/EgtB/PvdO family nonheme iron enzyme [Limnoraphis robusta]|uniref:SUMF1/EgtB/PvdO family nonheme iron enzyme n=1 Tax=Limnoraphis robusta CCNP1315 TaxID=3110306 RepID=A0ABU5U4I1_9CYAN|nr:SUMF1/EgtB/PvdO family nonheme iron enzyme [Limnoraphis robusta]MEA5522099.1 SUMF1/EgtB/PvdO family nonheme iron enzyme [Limnoraphis robusta CCNP1315]MEA5544197.1 SUMF1/EgtB/PvdO family nonheme iron enzyme [Limnoraphis robusta CCNP1324]
MNQNQPIEKIKILFLASNPRETQALALDEEVREITQKIRASQHRDAFDFKQRWAVRPDDLLQAFNEEKPHIVHFSGHGTSTGEIILLDKNSQAKTISTQAIKSLFSTLKDNIRVVLLNACYSRTQAEAITEVIDCVIGMNTAIGDEAARVFSASFYRAIGFGRSVQDSFEQARVALMLEGISEEDTPEFLHLKEVNPKEIILIDNQLNFANKNLNKTVDTVDIIKFEPTQKSPIAYQKFNFKYAKVEKHKLTGLSRFIHLSPQFKIQEYRRQAKYFAENLGGGITLEMIAIPGGNFLMGATENENYSKREHPQHEVTVQPFFMSKYPITQLEWRAVATEFPEVNRSLLPSPSKFLGKDNPVEQVSWEDATEFCDRLSLGTSRDYRLPTEAEWEYACRAGTSDPYHFGETLLPELAHYQTVSNSKKTSIKGTTPVGNFNYANAFGLYDMHGNVWEWCTDNWHESYKGASKDGNPRIKNGNSQYVIRGGSWQDPTENCRSACRKPAHLDEKGFYLGFRVVLSSSKIE